MDKPKRVSVLAGDGVGPEVMAEARKVLKFVEVEFGHQFELVEGLVGGAAYDQYGSHLPEETVQLCQSSDAILFGSVGGPVSQSTEPKWKDCERNSILQLRKHFQFAANLRPSKVYPELSQLCPLKKELVEKGVDLLIVRELLGDAYFGKHDSGTDKDQRYATDESRYTEHQIKTAAHAAFKCAEKRRAKLTSVDKANVLTTSRLWREVMHEVKREYEHVRYEDMLVDNCAMQLMRDPAQFDVIVTSNMFGDILSDAAAALPGSLGLVASASLNENNFGLYEPPGGSAQDIAGQGIANPIAQILSVSMLLSHSFSLDKESKRIEDAVNQTLAQGLRTRDIFSNREDETLVGTEQMADAIVKNMASKCQPESSSGEHRYVEV